MTYLIARTDSRLTAFCCYYYYYCVIFSSHNICSHSGVFEHPPVVDGCKVDSPPPTPDVTDLNHKAVLLVHLTDAANDLVGRIVLLVREVLHQEGVGILRVLVTAEEQRLCGRILQEVDIGQIWGGIRTTSYSGFFTDLLF